MSDPNKPQDATEDTSPAPVTVSETQPAAAVTASDTEAAAAESGDSARGASESSEVAPPAKRRRRRRRGGRNKTPGEETGAPAAAATAAPAPALDPGIAALAGGLLSHIDDRDVACSSDGCNNVWQWTATEQIAAYGQAPPRRECSRCTSTSASDIRCSVDGCKRTWSWSRDEQIKHRSWNKRRGDERGGGSGGGRKRRRGGDGPPRRKCEPCQAKLAKLTERPSSCKVHGCTRPVLIDRDVQLRGWAASGNTDLSFEAALPKQMCEVCREFCRTHDDRAVPCGRPGCEKSWTYKRGAQLQAFLAGRFEDPIRMCEGCESETRKAAHGSDTSANVDLMPCVVPGCDGVWHFRAGQKIAGSQDGEQPVQRMCDEHRKANGAEPRMKPTQGQDAPSKSEPEVVAVVEEEGSKSDPQITSSSGPIS